MKNHCKPLRLLLNLDNLHSTGKRTVLSYEHMGWS